MPFVITTINKKGGCGKTTATLSLALTAARATKEVVAVVDHDPQQSALLQIRLSKLPLTQCQSLDEVPKKAKYVFVDTPGLDLDTTRRAAKVASLLIIPCKPNILDLRASALTAQFALAAKRPTFWLPSMIDRRLTAHKKVNESLEDMMEEWPEPFPILPALGALSGQADFLDGKPGGKFEEQVAAVWAALKEHFT